MASPILRDIPMPIRTRRLLIRNPLPGDGAELSRVVTDSIAHLRPWLPWAQQAPSPEESEENVRRAHASWILREDLRLGLFDRAAAERGEMRVLGGSGLHSPDWAVPSAEIGYWLAATHVGQGLVTEAVAAISLFAFRELGARRLEIRCDVENVRSAAIPRRLGYTLEARLVNAGRKSDGSLRDTLVFARTDADGLPDVDARW